MALFGSIADGYHRSALPKALATDGSIVLAAGTDFPPAVCDINERLDMIREWCDATSESARREILDAPLLSVLRSKDDYVPALELAVGLQPLPDKLVLLRSAIERGDDGLVARCCPSCLHSLSNGTLPVAALANGLWVGDVPPELQSLNFVEKLLVARHRHSVNMVKLEAVKGPMGQKRYKGNAIVFPQPVTKFYHALPPHSSELDESLAVMLTGNIKAEDIEFKRTPLLVRRRVVLAALEWLKEHNYLYAGLTISYDNLQSYDEGAPPVEIFRRVGGGPAVVVEPAVNEVEGDRSGPATGTCSFAVSGLSGEDLDNMHTNEKIAHAIRHLRNGGKVAQYRHGSEPTSIYDAHDMFPAMFPWLFPYGHGGFYNTQMQRQLHRSPHVKHLLMFFDRRFQADEYFSYLLYNQEQIRSSNLGGYLLTERKHFDGLADKLMAVDLEALGRLVERTKAHGYAKPENLAESECMEILTYIDHVARHVPGSNTKRKYMKNEIKSLIVKRGAPSFFVTFSPADVKSPICLKMAGEAINLDSICPVLGTYDHRMRVVARNPVAGARFFDTTVRLFVKHILRFDNERPGIFGKPACYYGTVEEQGRLTLHLHLLVWIEGALSPQQLRDQLRTGDYASFERDFIAWLENCQRGEFSTSSEEDIAETIRRKKENPMQVADPYNDPTMCLPEKPPSFSCDSERDEWVRRMDETTDEIVYHSNRHSRNHGYGCKKHPNDECRARYPRELIPTSYIERETGHVFLKKLEAWINTYHPLMAYVLRCNGDVTSLLSGTLIRAIIAYVCDYITKSTLKTHAVFEAVLTVLRKRDDMFGQTPSRRDAARRLLVKIVNALTARKEVGGPMIAHELLGNPDHYTNEYFKVVYWFAYVRAIAVDTDTVINSSHQLRPTEATDERVVLNVSKHSVVGSTKLDDYRYRPRYLEHLSLYEFLSKTHCKRIENSDRKRMESFASQVPARRVGKPVGQTRQGGQRVTPTEPVLDRGKCYQLDPRHPLVGTHCLYVLAADSEAVVNFMGGALPRMKTDDIEFYSMCMMTLFAPHGWRHGSTLKGPHASWELAWKTCEFDHASRAIMANVNVLHECYDARDDLASRRKASGSSEALLSAPSMLTSEELEQLDCERIMSSVSEEMSTDMMLDLLDGDENQGKGKAYNHALRMHETMLTLERWNEEARTLGLLSDRGIADPTPVAPIERLATSEWKSRVSQAQDELAYAKSRDAALGVDRSVVEELRSAEQASPDEGSVVVTSMDSNLLHRSDQETSKYQFQGVAVSKCKRETVKLSELNEEQERAFNLIVAALEQHGSELRETFRMYLGGMGGTGKSQVLKAVIGWLTVNGEGYRIVVMAPTGTAASLVGGATYHSTLGLGTHGKGTSMSKLNAIRDRLRLVDLFFVDEVSMMSCLDVYKISEQLSRIYQNTLEPFGGKNIVLAGDFAQLPPIGGPAVSLYSRSIGLQSAARTLEMQKKTMGKALWHLIKIVVILRKNMRQQGMSDKDKAYRRMLENLRYKACDDADFALLESIRMGSLTCSTHVAQPAFRDVSIITVHNAQRDAINRVSVPRFAREHGEAIHRFQSIDKLPGEGASRTTSTAGESAMSDKEAEIYYDRLRRLVWATAPGLTEHVPGVLEICRGMPVMLKNNDATDLSITNGAEGTVYDWACHENVYGGQSLDTLFVKLTCPPRAVHIEGLPESVVPINSSSERVEVHLPKGKPIHVGRHQVRVLPNFAMTDFGSQGHEITKLQYLGELHEGVDGSNRADLIASYLAIRGDGYLPDTCHPSLKVTRSQDTGVMFALEARTSRVPWQIVSAKSLLPEELFEEMSPIGSAKRRADADEDDPSSGPPRKRMRQGVVLDAHTNNFSSTYHSYPCGCCVFPASVRDAV
ncbi:hypothetical protein EUX98_g7646 [Antrodiella citrinella]|uniref:ATP-dependent DNA helicase n=1 Tax=Antrodiella citrinella TaxID=2447956 RepID=A0A4S4MMW7_9APHY|nr:hypothetical protein EUX98_g7646 [Antrodiella citrinella]